MSFLSDFSLFQNFPGCTALNITKIKKRVQVLSTDQPNEQNTLTTSAHTEPHIIYPDTLNGLKWAYKDNCDLFVFNHSSGL